MTTWILVIAFYSHTAFPIGGYQTREFCERARTFLVHNNSAYEESVCIPGPELVGRYLGGSVLPN